MLKRITKNEDSMVKMYVILTNNQITMKKRALLIGAPGGINSQFLNGVAADLHYMKKHLISPQGGGWRDNEIITLKNATLKQIKSTFNELDADYTIILFSGHGSTDKYRRRLLHLTNGESLVDTFFLKLHSSRLLVLVDACRVFSPAINGFGTLSDEAYSHFEGNYLQLEYARRVYNNWIRNTSPGKVIIHSTDHLNSALDMGTGGLFTSTLLGYATNFKPIGKKCSGFDIISIGNKAALTISKNGYSQRPTIVHKEGNIKLPFALGIPEIISTQKSLPVKRNSNSGAGVVLSLLALGLIAAASKK